jgi:CubicO group peptidase (beta-lactamase class C family)
MLMAEIHGTSHDTFGAVREALAALLDQDDVGASVAVYVDGEPVVDIWGGYTDLDRTAPWERDTIVPVWSTTKTMTALCALMLADRGDLDLDAPVARYWPEFAAAGKDRVLVKHVLSHTAGLPDWDEPLTVTDLYDWPRSTALLAAQPPRWEPGTDAGYHSVTFGHLVGEVLRRITGQSVGEFFAENVAGPLGADFHIGLAAEHDGRVGPAIAPPGQTDEFTAAAPTDTAAVSTFSIRVADGNTAGWRRAGVPAAGGFGNARSTALVQSTLANGGSVRGVQLMSEAGCHRAQAEQFRGVDRALGLKMRYGMGFGLFGTMFGWGGWGGSLVMIDPDARMAVAYVMNRMLDPRVRGDERGLSIIMAAYDGIRG